MEDFFSDAIKEIRSGKIKNKSQLQRRKSDLAEKYSLKRLPTDADILQTTDDKASVLSVLQKKPSRTMSGVTVVAIMTEPSKCPHGKCVYCPGGSDIDTPQSYTGQEPAAMRGAQCKYDSYEQVKSRVEQLEIIGHPADKIELIIMGGTFPSRDFSYQEKFIRRAYDALNGKDSKTIAEAQLLNEKAEHRCVGMTIETRPDYCKQKEINVMLDYGATRVELGVQNPDDSIYELVNRGHTVADVTESTKLLKDSFLKINYHMMPGLPGSSPSEDIKMFKKIFEDERFKPDMLKIYPCLLINPDYGKTELYEMYKRGEWKPYTDEEAATTIAKASKYFPKWMRVMRIQRDIPTKLILDGVQSSNLRQLVDVELKKQKIECQCIRCREIRNEKLQEVELKRIDYGASDGKEVFLSFETKADKLVGFTRLRIPDEPFRKEITKETAGIRELHVYGPAAKIGEKSEFSQHQGFGKRLVAEAEKIAREEFDMKDILVISGVGVRDYYRKLGYERSGVYMGKALK